MDDDLIKKLGEDLSSRLKVGKQVLDLCEKDLLELQVGEKTLKEWGDILKVKIPLDTDDVNGLDRAQAEVSNKIQQAEFLLALFEVQGHTSKKYFEAEYSKKYVQIMNSGRKEERLAADKLKQLALANEEISLSAATTESAEIIQDFFKRIVEALKEARKGIENRVKILQVKTYRLS